MFGVRVVLDLITVTFLHGYVTRPMHVFGLAGLASMGAGLLSLLATVWMKAHSGIFMTGNPLLLLSAMLELVTGRKVSDCSGLSRREFLTIGGLSALGLTLPSFLRM